MSSSSSRLLPRVFGHAVRVISITSLVGLTGLTAYACSDQGRGFKRQVHFWSVLSPAIVDYWWNGSDSSPYVRWKWNQIQKHPQQHHLSSLSQLDTVISSPTSVPMTYEEFRQQNYNLLHERNAPRIFQVMLDLSGLYIKLGQVLSVTTLPIPESYRRFFRTLQSSVPSHQDFDQVIKPILERELGNKVDDLFETFDYVPCGAASIGQAHKARLRHNNSENISPSESALSGTDVIVKVQYPDAKWQVPADIQCAGDLLKLCVYFGVVEDVAAKLFYQEFSQQFLSELDYQLETQNLQKVHQSTLDPTAPYQKHGVVVPKVFPHFCTGQVITMTYLPGPKFEDEVKRHLQLLGIPTNRSLKDIVRQATDVANQTENTVHALATDGGLQSHVQTSNTFDQSQAHTSNTTNVWTATTNLHSKVPSISSSWSTTLAKSVGQFVSVDSMLSIIRMAQKISLWSQVAAVNTIHFASRLSLAPAKWQSWAHQHQHAASQARLLEWNYHAIYALFDVHGYQILNQGLFNADPHPGNLLVVYDQNHTPLSKPKIGLIDYGQCKRLSPDERVRLARLFLSVAENASDEVIANNFRDLGIRTKNDSTPFLAEFARLMFGAFRPEHLNHTWHMDLHSQDKVTYFPVQLLMVYRTCLLLRGLAMSLQLNVSVAEQYQHHARLAIQQHNLLQINPNLA